MTFKRKKLWIGLATYLLLWIATGLVGLPQADRAFNREFASGSGDGFASAGHTARQVASSRVPYTRVTDPSAQSLPDLPFHSRSTGFPIAPFLIVDEACVAEAPLAGFSGRRIVFWFFGYCRWMPLQVWWVS
jgi:hypothetical protein